MSPRERYEQAVASLRADGYRVTESSQSHGGGTLHSATLWMSANPSLEEQQALLAAAARAGANYSRSAHADGMVTHSAWIQWVEPAPEAAHA